MKIDKIRDEELHCNIKRKAAKISALLSAKLINLNVLPVKKSYFLIKVK